jgi:hypothetical protein
VSRDVRGVEKFGKIDDSWVFVGVGAVFYLGRQVDADWARNPVENTGLPEDPDDPTEEPVDEPEGLFLAPCYRIYIATIKQGSDVMDVPQCQPYGGGLFGFTTKVEIAHYDTCVEVGDLEESDRLVLVEMVNVAEQVKHRLRARRIGLIAPNGSLPA